MTKYMIHTVISVWEMLGWLVSHNPLFLCSQPEIVFSATLPIQLQMLDEQKELLTEW
jgi:hypothetical protein